MLQDMLYQLTKMRCFSRAFDFQDGGLYKLPSHSLQHAVGFVCLWGEGRVFFGGDQDHPRTYWEHRYVRYFMQMNK